MTVYILSILACIVAILVFAQGNTDYNYALNDTTPGQYRFFYEKSGVTVYSSWVVVNGKTVAVNFKLINNTDALVVVTWTGPQWYSKGIYLEASKGQNVAKGYAEQFVLHEKGNNNCTTEVFTHTPNYLYFDAPDGDWKQGQLTITFTNFQVTPQSKFRLTTAAGVL